MFCPHGSSWVLMNASRVFINLMLSAAVGIMVVASCQLARFALSLPHAMGQSGHRSRLGIPPGGEP
jgi:hypothetical protein